MASTFGNWSMPYWNGLASAERSAEQLYQDWLLGGYNQSKNSNSPLAAASALASNDLSGLSNNPYYAPNQGGSEGSMGPADTGPDQGPAPGAVASAVGSVASALGQMAGLNSIAAAGLGGGVRGGMSGKGVGVGAIDGVFGGLMASLGPVGALAAMGLNAIGFSLGRGFSEMVSPTHEAPGYEGGFFSDPGKGVGISADPGEGVGGWGGLPGDTPGYGPSDLGQGIGTTGIGIGSPGLGGLQGTMADTFGGLSDPGIGGYGGYGGDPDSSGPDGDGSGGGNSSGSDSGPGANGGEDGGASDGNAWAQGGLVQYSGGCRC